tara:strand:- start:623 stop:757 length:135 start_codon:yes stop_codon:yes gene_type:complete
MYYDFGKANSELFLQFNAPAAGDTIDKLILHYLVVLNSYYMKKE